MSTDKIDQAFFKKLLREACDSKNDDKPKNVGIAMAMVVGAKKNKSRYSKIQKFLGIIDCENTAVELQFMFYYNLYEYLVKDVPGTDVSYWKQLLIEHRYKEPDQSNDLWTNIFGNNAVNIKGIYMSDDGKIMKQEEKSAGEDGFDPDFFETFFSEDEDEESEDINTDSNGEKDIVLGNEKEKEANNQGRNTDDIIHERDKTSGDTKVENPLNSVQHKSKSQDNAPASAQGPHLAFQGMEASRVGDLNFSEIIETDLSQKKKVTIEKCRMTKMTMEELVKQEQCWRKVSSDNIECLYECLCCNIRCGELDFKKHLVGAKHRKAALKFENARSAYQSGWLKKEKIGYSCSLCNKRMNTEVDVVAHLAGAKHKKKAVSKLRNKTSYNKADEHDNISKNIESENEKGLQEKAPILGGMCNAWNKSGVCHHKQCWHLHRCNFCGGEHPRISCTTKSIKSENEKGLQEKRPLLDGMCNAWNKSGVCHHKQCWHLHRCSSCGGEHPRLKCPTEIIKSENEKGLQEKRPLLVGMCNAWNKSGVCHHKQCWHLHRCSFCGGEHPRLKCPTEIIKTENEKGGQAARSTMQVSTAAEGTNNLLGKTNPMLSGTATSKVTTMKGISGYEMSNMLISSGTNLSIPPPGCRIPTSSPASTYMPNPIPPPTPVSLLTFPPPSHNQSSYIPNPIQKPAPVSSIPIPSAPPPVPMSSLTIPPPSHIQSPYIPNSVPPPAPISSLTIPTPSHIQSSYTPNPVPPPAPISSLTIPPPSHIQSSYTPNPVPPPAPISSLTFPPPSHIQSSYTPSPVPPPAPKAPMHISSASDIYILPSSQNQSPYIPSPVPPPGPISSIITPGAPTVSTSLPHLAPLPPRLQNLTDTYDMKTAVSRNLSDLGLTSATKQNHVTENLNIKLNNENLAEGIWCDRSQKGSYNFSTNRRPDEKDNNSEKINKRHRGSESKSPERKQRKYSISPDRCYEILDRNHDRKQQKKLRSKSPDRHDRSSQKNVQINEACNSLMSVCDKIGILGHSLRAALEKTQKYKNDSSKIIETFSDQEGQELLLLIVKRLNKLCEETKDNMLRSLFKDASLATSLLLNFTKSYSESSNSDTGSERSSENYSFNDRCSSKSGGMNNDIESSIHIRLKNIYSDNLNMEEKKLIQRISEGKLKKDTELQNEYLSSNQYPPQQFKSGVFKVAIFGHDYVDRLPVSSGAIYQSKFPGASYQVMKYSRHGAEITKAQDYNIWSELISAQPNMIFLILGKNDFSTSLSPSDLSNGMLRIKMQLEKRIPNVDIACFGVEKHLTGHYWSDFQEKVNSLLEAQFRIFISPSADIDIGAENSEATMRVWFHIRNIIEQEERMQNIFLSN